jgi:2-polyprenyl-6-methoxyphenol hydroxylase-like FAD-dependent oxidoreductase
VVAAAECDVAIAGYGPVGQLLAILLAQRGWNVRVFERWPSSYPLPRAVHFDHEVARILQGAGVMDELAPHTEPAHVYEWRNATGETLLRIGRDADQSVSGWPASNMVNQPALERILDARVRAFPNVHVELGSEVVDVIDDGEGVTVVTRRGHDETHETRARFAIGCDGANSFVRGRIGAGWHDLGFHFDWLVVDLVPHVQRVWEPSNWQLCDPARPTTLVSGGPGRRRFEFMRLPHETVEAIAEESVTWKLLEPWGIGPDDAKLERHAVYTFRARWADRWRCGRVLLAGDAAHLMPPFAGQGMCSGLRDAANLAWKLDLVLGGKAADALLDTYESERLPHARATIELSVALGRIICVPDPEEAAARDRRMVAEARERGGPTLAPLPPVGPGCFLASRGAQAPGPQERVRAARGEGLFDDVVGRGFVLLSPHGDPGEHLGPELARFFGSIGGVTAQVGADTDVGGGYARWFAQHGVAVALQRPDFQIFGTADALEAAPELVAALRDRLAASP